MASFNLVQSRPVKFGTNAGTVSLRPIIGTGQKGDQGDPGNTGPQGPPGPGTGAGAWQPSTAYVANQVVQASDGSIVQAVVNHTSSSSFATDYAAGKWKAIEDVTGTVANTALVNKYVQRGIESTQRFMTKVNADQGDVHVLIVTDSTGRADSTTVWPYLLAQSFGTMFPTHSVQYHGWSVTNSAYNEVTTGTLSTGTGSNTIHVWNAGVHGYETVSWQGTLGELALYSLDPQPDLILVALGHNEGLPANVDNEQFHGQMVSLTEQLSSRIPDAPLVLIIQNPELTGTVGGVTGDEGKLILLRELYGDIAANRGYGFIDCCQPFLDLGDYSTVMLDQIHPDATGQNLWFTVVKAAFVLDHKSAPRPQRASTLLTLGENLLRNPAFASGMDYWQLTNASHALDATNFESAVNTTAAPSAFTGTAQKVTATAAAGFLWQSLPISRVKGRWITLAVRMLVPTGASNNVGIIGISDSVSTMNTVNTQFGQGAFAWKVITKFIPSTATSAFVRIYADAGSGLGGVTVDRVTCVVGKYPGGLAQEPGGLPGLASYAPTFDGAGGTALGNGTATGGYFLDKSRGLCQFYAKVTLGSTSVVGTYIDVGLPVAAVTATAIVGMEIQVNRGAGATRGNLKGALQTSTSKVRLYKVGADGFTMSLVNATSPLTWTTGDVFTVGGTYQAA